MRLWDSQPFMWVCVVLCSVWCKVDSSIVVAALAHIITVLSLISNAFYRLSHSKRTTSVELLYSTRKVASNFNQSSILHSITSKIVQQINICLFVFFLFKWYIKKFRMWMSKYRHFTTFFRFLWQKRQSVF